MTKSYGPVVLSAEVKQALQFTDDSDEFAKLRDVQLETDELTALLKEYGGHYPVPSLLEAAEAGISTHTLAREVPCDSFFIILPDTHRIAIDSYPNQYQRLPNPFGDDVVDGKIAAVPVLGIGKKGRVEKIEADTVVRPLMGGDYHHTCGGSMFYTPEEYAAIQEHNQRYEEKITEIETIVTAAIEDTGVEEVVIFSANPTDENGLPVNNLDQVPVEGPLYLCYEERYSDRLLSPTWLQLTVAINRILEANNTVDHVFFEAICPTKRTIQDAPVYEASMGS